MRNFIIKSVARIKIVTLFFLANTAYATTFNLPPTEDALLGQIEYVTARTGDTPAKIGERFNIGVNAIVNANSGIPENRYILAGTPIKVASEFLIPPVPREGIVVNLPEMRLYYFPKGSNKVMTFPVGIGRIGKTIPVTQTSIWKKVINPVWIPTEAERVFNSKQGISLPRVMPAGPDNPLGPYAIYLHLPTFLIHSTIFPDSIGTRASFGCIRMNETDIKQFFPNVTARIPVEIIDMPAKIGWEGNALYLEAHPPLEERANEPSAKVSGVLSTVANSLPNNHVTLVNWQMVAYLAEQPDGVPHQIGVRVK